METNRITHKATAWDGWVYFASFMMILSGAFGIIAGLTAIFQNTVYVLTNTHLVAFDITQWGWIHFILGIVVIAAGLALLSGRTWGRVFGVIMASLSAIANFAFIDAYPWWSIAIILVDIFVIYAIVVHGGELRQE